MQFNITKTIEENKSLAESKYIYNKTYKRFEEKNGENWAPINSQIKKNISEPTGFALLNNESDIFSSVITFSIDGSRILSISPSNEYFIFYVNGKEYIKTDVSQVQISDIEGLHYIYFNDNGILEERTDFDFFDITKKYASVATVYWNYTDKKAIYIGDKRHSINNDAYQNYLYFLEDKSVDYIEGTILKFTNNKDGSVNDKVDGDGTSNYHTSFAMEGGKYRNYDLLNNSEHIEFNENMPIFYKESISQEKNWVAMATNGSVIVAIANDGEYRLMISQDDGETWQKIFLSSFCVWEDIIYANNKFVAIASEGQYSVVTSNNGLNWEYSIVPQKNKWKSITFGNGLFIVVGINGTNQIMSSNNGIYWNAISTPNFLPLTKVKYIANPDNSFFMAISENDILELSSTTEDVKAYSKAFVSQDGITWVNKNISQEKKWNIINYENGRFIALANYGKFRLLTTTDTNIWPSYELINSDIDSQNWVSLTYGSGYHMAISKNGTNRFIRSNSGITWESKNIGNNDWTKITVGGGITVIVAKSGTNRIKFSSNNGETWTDITSQDTKSLEDIIYANNKWYLISSSTVSNGGRISYSNTSDIATSTWTGILTRDEVAWKSIAYGNNKFVVVGQEDISWKPVTVTSQQWQAITFGNGKFVAVSADGTNRVMTSIDGKTWTTYSGFANEWTSVTYGANKFVAVARSGAHHVMTSPDGITWTSINSAPGGEWASITFGDNIFVAVANGGTNRIMTSTDGTNWSLKVAPANNAWQSVTFGEGKFVAVSSDGTGNSRVMYSLSSGGANTWVLTDAASNSAWQSVTYGSIFLATSVDINGSKVMTSEDGINWESQIFPVIGFFTKAFYANGYFVVIGISGQVLVSKDGVSWEVRTGVSGGNWSDIAFGNNIFVAVGGKIINAVTPTQRVMSDYIDNNKIIYSNDGVTWNNSNINGLSEKNWKKVKYLENGFFALNTDNEVYYSVSGESNWLKVEFDENLKFTDFIVSGKILLVFLTETNRIVVSGLIFDSVTRKFNNTRFLNTIDNISFTDLETDGNGKIALSTRENKVMVSNDNGVIWNIKDINDSKVNKIKYINNNFILLGYAGTNRITYSSNLFNTMTYIGSNFLNYSFVDLIHKNNSFIFLMNSGDKRVLVINNLIGTLQADLVLNFKDVIKDVYNSWKRVDNFDTTEMVKPRCIIKNKINYNKINSNNLYSLEECNTNKFYLYHVFMSNDKDNKYIIVAGNYEYGSQQEAKNAILDEINKLNGLPFNDFLPLGSILYEVNNNYNNTAKARIINVNGSNYYKLIKKDLVSSAITYKKENSGGTSNNDLINIYGNKILEFALNKLQNLTSRDIDNFITRKEITIPPVGDTNLNVIFGSQITGFYEIFDKNNPEIAMILFLKQNLNSIEPDINITSYTSKIITNKSDSSGSNFLAVYIENGVVSFKNLTKTDTINLVIYRKI